MTPVNAMSDCHLRPGDRFDKDLSGIDKLVLVGDTFDILPYGIKAWREIEGQRTVNSLLDFVPADTTFDYGNHDPARWLRELVDPFPVVKYVDVDINGKPYRFIHGHQFSEWRYLSWIADDVTDWMVSGFMASLWYKFCKAQGWMASGMSHSSEKYAPLVAGIWGLALRYAHEKAHNVNLVIGHTHTPAVIETPWHKVIDLGANTLREIG